MNTADTADTADTYAVISGRGNYHVVQLLLKLHRVSTLASFDAL